jgi:aldose 1-epimerase
MAPQTRPLPTGEQFDLRRDGPRGVVTATVTELAASLRALRVHGVPLVQEYPDELPPPGGAGIVLVPWPNRVAGGRWMLDGEEQLLDATEPATGNASHGLLRNTGYAVRERSDNAVTLAATVFPQHGYAFHLGTSVRYALHDDGLEVTHTVVNHSPAAAPVAIGAHPYLRVGDVPVEELVVTVSGETYLEVDERQIPTGTRPAAGTGYDLRHGARIGDLRLDTAYTDLQSIDGAYRHRVHTPDGASTELWADLAFGYVHVYTRPGFPGPDGPVTALAIEPMTAPANALNTGAGLRWLATGESWSVSWGLRRMANGS